MPRGGTKNEGVESNEILASPNLQTSREYDHAIDTTSVCDKVDQLLPYQLDSMNLVYRVYQIRLKP